MLEINPMAGALGAEIVGLDLSQDLSPENVSRVRELLNEYEVIFFGTRISAPPGRRLLRCASGRCKPIPLTKRWLAFRRSPFSKVLLKNLPKSSAGIPI